MHEFDTSRLRAGDILLYRPGKLRNGFLGWFFGKIICLKTWTRVSHVEIYAGNGDSVASRDGKGVARYPLRLDGIGFVLRPNRPFNFEKGLMWFYNKAEGQGYDWLGLLVFAHAVKAGNPYKMFCSEFATRFFDRCNCPLFSPEWDADRVPPSMMLSSLALEVEWSDNQGL